MFAVNMLIRKFLIFNISMFAVDDDENKIFLLIISYHSYDFSMFAVNMLIRKFLIFNISMFAVDDDENKIFMLIISYHS